MAAPPSSISTSSRGEALGQSITETPGSPRWHGFEPLSPHVPGVWTWVSAVQVLPIRFSTVIECHPYGFSACTKQYEAVRPGQACVAKWGREA